MTDNKKDESYSAPIELEEWKDFFKNDLNKLQFRLGGEKTEKKMNENSRKGLDYLIDNQKKILTKILSEILKRYPDWQEEYGYDEDEKKADHLLPRTTNTSSSVVRSTAGRRVA